MRSPLLLALLLACSEPAPLAATAPPEAFGARAAPAATAPNVVVILTDDMRADLLPFLPNVQRLLVDSGVTFTKAFDNSPLCCPSRTSFLTGQMQHATGVRGNVAPYGGATVFGDAATLATDLHAVGYTTALIGKYLNEYNKLPANYVPPGWDEWRVYEQPHYQTADLVEKAWDSTAVHRKTYTSYTPGVLRNRVATFLQRAPAAQPVFLFFTPYAPHFETGPLRFPVAAAQDVGKCAAIPMPAWSAAFNEADVSDKPAYVRAAPLLTASQQLRADSARRAQCEALFAVDRTVGDIVTLLGQTGRLSNSLLVFATDNGYLLGEHRLVERKAAMYEEAVRTPLVIRGLGARLAAVDTNLVQLIDVSATIRAVAGVPPVGPGRDLRPAAATSAWTTDALLVEMDNAPKPAESFAMLRTHEYAYAEYPSGGPGGAPFAELYDLRVDPAELVNRAADPAYAPVLQQLHARLVVLQST